jgi:hypothetical protein
MIRHILVSNRMSPSVVLNVASAKFSMGMPVKLRPAAARILAAFSAYRLTDLRQAAGINSVRTNFNKPSSI